jgi:hypothetical protein
MAKWWVYNSGMDTQQPKSAAQALPEQPQNAPTAPKYDPTRHKRGLYGSMTWAFNNRDDLDKLGNAQEEAMRTWYRENPTAFLDRYTKLAEARNKKPRSRSHRPKKAKDHPKAPQPPEKAPQADQAMDKERLDRVMQELFADFEASQRERKRQELLNDMLWVATHPPEMDRTHSHRTQRKLFEADKQRFMDKLTDLEKDGPSNPSEQAEPPPQAPEHPKDRALRELTLEVLAQFEALRERELSAGDSSPGP